MPFLQPDRKSNDKELNNFCSGPKIMKKLDFFQKNYFTENFLSDELISVLTTPWNTFWQEAG